MRTRRTQPSSNSVSAAGGHRSVLLHEVIEHLAVNPEDTVVDATLGGAGHARAIVDLLGPEGRLIGLDADEAAIGRAREALADSTAKVELVQGNFRRLGAQLDRLGVGEVDAFLFDLGWSGFQLSAGRGFSFQSDEPLLMTYQSNPGERDLTASIIVNEWGEESLADIIYGWGEERYARRIAAAIVAARTLAPIATARQLAEIIAHAVPGHARHGRTHPATKTFQALRIAVNDEFGAIEDGLKAALAHAAAGARIAVITFHSMEDRLVKRIFKRWQEDGKGEMKPRRVITPSKEECAENPRARSAKLRIFICS